MYRMFQFSLFMHPDQAQNTSSGIQGQEATAVAVIYVTAPNSGNRLYRMHGGVGGCEGPRVI